MKGNISMGGSLEIRIPSPSTAEYAYAAGVLKAELDRRVDLTIRIVAEASIDTTRRADLVIQLAALEHLDDEAHLWIDPPVKIAPYPDSAEHINLRIDTRNAPNTIWVICGSLRSLCFGVGALFRFFQFDADGLRWDLEFANLQPLNPLRGCLFLGNDRILDKSEWNSLLSDHVLWGNNVVGCNLASISGDLLDCIASMPLSLISSLSDGQEIPLEIPAKYFLLSKSVANHSMQSFCEEGRRLGEWIGKQRENAELWIGCEGFCEEELSEFFDVLLNESIPSVNALVCGPGENELYGMIKQEMPLTLQLISLNPLIEDRFSPRYLADRFYDFAPLTYGALGISLDPRDEVARFIWSMLSWSPQPKLEEILQYYGHWYFGAAAAEPIREALLACESSEQEALSYLSSVENRVPPAMRKSASSRIENLRRWFRGAD